MDERDLPEPKKITYTPQQRRQRRWQLILTSLVFCTAYTLLHKLIVPGVLKFTPLKTSPYSQIDLWLVFPLILVAVLRRQGETGKWGSFLCGVGILYGIYEAWEISQGRYPGWLGVSRFLSSAPIALCCVILMTTTSFNRKLGYAWLGALALSMAVGIGEYRRPSSKVMADASNNISRKAKKEPLRQCGASEIEFHREDHALGEVSTLEIKDCGLSPSVIFLPSSTLNLKNLRTSGLNLHLIYEEKGRRVSGWNLTLPAQGNSEQTLEVHPGRVGLIYSDTHPQMGIALVLSKNETQDWTARRSPLKLEVSP